MEVDKDAMLVANTFLPLGKVNDMHKGTDKGGQVGNGGKYIGND